MLPLLIDFGVANGEQRLLAEYGRVVDQDVHILRDFLGQNPFGFIPVGDVQLDGVHARALSYQCVQIRLWSGHCRTHVLPSRVELLQEPAQPLEVQVQFVWILTSFIWEWKVWGLILTGSSYHDCLSFKLVRTRRHFGRNILKSLHLSCFVASRHGGDECSIDWSWSDSYILSAQPRCEQVNKWCSSNSVA